MFQKIYELDDLRTTAIRTERRLARQTNDEPVTLADMAALIIAEEKMLSLLTTVPLHRQHIQKGTN